MTATESVAGCLGESFLAQVYRRTHHIWKAAVPDAAALLSFNDLNGILVHQRLESPRLRLTVNGDPIPLPRYSTPQVTRRSTVWQRIQPAQLHTLLAEGATLVLDSIDEIHPPIGELATTIERTLRTGVQVNAYASWTPTEGFGIHWDDHDTVIVQASGSKRWKIYGPTRLYPSYRDVATPSEPTGDPIDEFVLEAGDMLYVPRGHWHSVSASEGDASLHLTCGLQTTTGAELINYLADELRERETVRADVPQFADSAARRLYRQQLADEVAELLEDDDLIERFFTHRDVTDSGRFAPSLPYLGDVPDDAGLSVRLTTPRAHLEETEESVRLRAGGEVWEFDPAVAPIFAALIGGRSALLGELATRSGLPLPEISKLITELVSHQVAAIGSAS